MVIPCDAPLPEVILAYLEAGDFTSSSRTTYRRVLSELARDLDPQRPADSITAEELTAWFVRTHDTTRRPPGTGTGSSSARSPARSKPRARRWICH
jgi:hypothetical protein